MLIVVNPSAHAPVKVKKIWSQKTKKFLKNLHFFPNLHFVFVFHDLHKLLSFPAVYTCTEIVILAQAFSINNIKIINTLKLSCPPSLSY